ncbi:MAG TPA: energy transducer TonB [Candidatus Aquilonibacter sp.]|nr:energy transducer TonB [Candidatus Aquilonibacter sp.]
MPLLMQDTSVDDYAVSAPPHSRLPRLDLGIDWTPRWEEFRTSLRGVLTGPKPAGKEAVSGGEHLRVEWIRAYRPRSPFLVAVVFHALAIWLITLPIWGFLPTSEADAVPMQLQLSWDLPADLPPITLPARAEKKSSTPPRRANSAPQQAQSGADAFNPHQTILSVPVRLTHPRQTLIEPEASMKAPKVMEQMPNVVQWSAPEILRPTIEYSTSKSKPELRRVQGRSVAAPQIANAAKMAEPESIAQTDVPQLAPPAPVPSAAVIASRRTIRRESVFAPQIADSMRSSDQTDLTRSGDVRLAPPAPLPSNSRIEASLRAELTVAAAPEVHEQTDGNPADVRKLIAISAAPAPPKSDVKLPEGNLAANVAISPDGKRPGTPGGAEHGATTSKSTSLSSANADSLPAAISVSNATEKPSNGGVARIGGLTPHLDLSMRPTAPGESTTARSVRTGPANVAALPPGAPPEDLLSGERFSMHVSTPDTTSTRGSWLFNFAQLGENPSDIAKPDTTLSGPEPIYTVDPRYPPETMVEHITGEVVLYAIIRKDGTVDSIQLVRSLDPRLDKAAMQALAQWKFRPGSRGGVPVDLEAVIHVPFEYRQLNY